MGIHRFALTCEREPMNPLPGEDDMDLNILDHCEALRGLTPQERAEIAALGQELSFAPGQPILEEGSQATSFAFLLSGKAQVLKGGRAVVELSPGALLGEMALFNKNIRTGEVRAVEACTLLSVPVADFTRLVLEHNPAAVRLMEGLGRVMVQRLQEWDARLLRQAGAPDAVGAGQTGLPALRKRLLADWALQYHALGKPGKLTVTPSKPVGTAADLSVAYSPGVAEPCLEIRRDPAKSYDYTARGHLVGVVTNGTAVLGLGNIGALAGKPVMEGKAVLFKRFADLDSFDVEVNETDPARFIDVVCAIAPTFGGINLEDVRSPECFFIEEECKRRLDIPVFHDDQHGTAIIAGAGLLNALDVVGKRIDAVRVVFSGAGAAGFACARYFLRLGVPPANLVLADIKGVVYKGRGDGNYLDEIAADTPARTLAQALEGADVFVGLSAAGILTPDILRTMRRDPVVFALANPVPEIDYPLAVQTRPDVIMATGRSDYPNQINNVIAFPYIFRGALDCRARTINDDMKVAATRVIAALAREPVTAEAGPEVPPLSFGRDYLIPKPFDRRLLTRVAPAVAEAAMQTGVARVQLDLASYRRSLEHLARVISES
jgi:malic enzyme/CRP-like cAMP-binding protein